MRPSINLDMPGFLFSEPATCQSVDNQQVVKPGPDLDTPVPEREL